MTCIVENYDYKVLRYKVIDCGDVMRYELDLGCKELAVVVRDGSSKIYINNRPVREIPKTPPSKTIDDVLKLVGQYIVPPDLI